VEVEAADDLVQMAPGGAVEASSPLGLRLAVEPNTVRPGSNVTLLLRNETPHQIGYNLCASALEQMLDGMWRTVPQEGVCTLELRTLSPGQVASYKRKLPDNVATGRYRFRTSVETPQNPATPGLGWIVSEPFTVQA
jgi:hypothetical protein